MPNDQVQYNNSKILFEESVLSQLGYGLCESSKNLACSHRQSLLYNCLKQCKMNSNFSACSVFGSKFWQQVRQILLWFAEF